MSTIVLSAGGTGGHLFPAQALAAELLRRGHRVIVMSDARAAAYGTAFPGTQIETVPSASFASRSPLRLAMALLQILAGITVASAKLLRLRPAAVIGFGGYPSLPVMISARLLGLNTFIHEQNAVLGRVNRRIANSVRAVAASFPLAKFAPKDAHRVVFTGNPVRPEAVALAGAVYTVPSASAPINLLVFGGSQGARALSEIVPAAVAQLPDGLKVRLSVTQQCRPEDLEAVRAAYAVSGVKAELASFFNDLPKRIAATHLVISRSGASTISELAVIGRPAILVPYPYASDDHQTANAKVFTDAGAAWSFQQRDLSAENLAGRIVEIFAAPDKLVAAAAAAAKLGRPNAASELANLVEGKRDLA